MSIADEPVGFIGLGLMGTPMAKNLLEAGRRLIVWNRTDSKLGALVDAGAQAAGAPAEVAERARIVHLCLTDTDAVEAVAFGEHGLHEGSARLIVDHSSIRPDATRDFATRLETACATRWVDAPVSGGVRGAKSGALAIMAGGGAEDIALARDSSAPLCARFTHMGPVGAGQTAKLCNQMIVAANLAVIAEATHLAHRAGVKADKLAEAFAGGFADSGPLQVFQPRMANRVFEPPLGAAYTMLKDVDAARDLGRDLEAPLPMTAAACEILRALMAKGHGQDDIATLITLYED